MYWGLHDLIRFYIFINTSLCQLYNGFNVHWMHISSANEKLYYMQILMATTKKMLEFYLYIYILKLLRK